MRHKIVEGTPEWHKMRLDYIGGSEIASLFGVQPKSRQSKFELYHVKSRKTPPRKLDDGVGSRIWYGKEMEPTIAGMAAKIHGWQIEKGDYYTDDECPGMGCSVDYLILEPGPVETKEGFHGPGVMQVKNSDYIQHKEEWTGGEPPFYTMLQLQHELACTGLEWGVIPVLVGGNLIEAHRYPASVRLATSIRDTVTTFWADVRHNRVPNTDGSDSTAATLKMLYPTRQSPRPLDFSGDKDFVNACIGFRTASANLNSSKDHYATAKNYLESLIKGETRAVGDGVSVSVSVNSANGGRTIRVREIPL